jgi:hypothetical protein
VHRPPEIESWMQGTVDRWTRRGTGLQRIPIPLRTERANFRWFCDNAPRTPALM